MALSFSTLISTRPHDLINGIPVLTSGARRKVREPQCGYTQELCLAGAESERRMNNWDEIEMNDNICDGEVKLRNDKNDVGEKKNDAMIIFYRKRGISRARRADGEHQE